mmetsp:Transcript_7775/g.21171  ORF Transcript_7775/g.21171 Transcript_7775/m.21171 type:complete len:356 (-) Transcript_7775:302-1369(-)
MEPIGHVVHTLAVEFHLDTTRQKSIASDCLDIADALLRERAHWHEHFAQVGRERDAGSGPGRHLGGLVPHLLQNLPLVVSQVLNLSGINFVHYDHHRLVGKERTDGMKQCRLLFEREPALLRDVDHVQHSSAKMRQRRDALHLDGVPLLKRPVQDSWCVNHLPTQVLIVGVPHEQTLCGEGIRLHFNVGTRHLVHERTFPHVGISTDEKRPGVWIDGRKSRHVLPDLFQVGKGRRLALDQRAHPPKRSALELLRSVQRVCVLEQPDIIICDAGHELLGRVQLPQSQLVVIFIVQNVEQIPVERMNLVCLGEAGEDRAQPIHNVRGCEFHLARVKLTDTLDGPAVVNDRRRLALGL